MTVGSAMVRTPWSTRPRSLATASVMRSSSLPHSSGKFCCTSVESTTTCSCMYVRPRSAVSTGPRTVSTCAMPPDDSPRRVGEVLRPMSHGARSGAGPSSNQKLDSRGGTMINRVIGAALTVAAVGIGLSACSSSGKKVSATGSTVTTAAPAASASASAGGGIYGDAPTSTAVPAAAASSGPLVSVATDAKHGRVLVGANGHTLYLFEKDSGTTSACTGGCAAVWPGLTATGGTMAG